MIERGIDEYLTPLTIGEDKLHALACQFSTTYKQLALHSTEQFLPTPISSLPTGQERGRFLSIDVGGTNLRVGFIELLGDAVDEHRTLNNFDHGASLPASAEQAAKARIRMTFEKAWPIEEHFKMDKAEDLFGWIGDCIAEVVEDSVSATILEGEEVPQELAMGVTFSFPMM